MVVVWVLAGGDEDELIVVHCVVTLMLRCCEGCSQCLAWPRGQVYLIGIDVNEPVGIQRAGELFLAPEYRLPVVDPVFAREVLYADQAAP